MFFSKFSIFFFSFFYLVVLDIFSNFAYEDKTVYGFTTQ